MLGIIFPFHCSLGGCRTPVLEKNVLFLRFRELWLLLVPGRISLCRRENIIRTLHPGLWRSSSRDKEAGTMNLLSECNPDQLPCGPFSAACGRHVTGL